MALEFLKQAGDEVATAGSQVRSEHLDRYSSFIARAEAFVQTMAEPTAAPNGGPAERLGDSGVTDGPPSVS